MNSNFKSLIIIKFYFIFPSDECLEISYPIFIRIHISSGPTLNNNNYYE